MQSLSGEDGLDLGDEAVVQVADLVGVDGHGGAPFVSVGGSGRRGRAGPRGVIAVPLGGVRTSSRASRT